MASIVIAQGGGPTAVINSTLSGAIQRVRQLDPTITVLGSRKGIEGLMARDVVDLSSLGPSDLTRLGNTPGAALGSTRNKPDPAAAASILEALKEVQARGFIYIGGNDTAGTLELLRANGSGFCQFVHAPKTIDNDLMENDHTPGFISAANFNAHAFASVDLDVRAFGGIYVGIVMGRHAGFLTAAPVAWQKGPDDAPHLFYPPERSFTVARFISEITSVYKRLGRCVVAMSEGVQDESGTPLAITLANKAGQEIARDAHGNAQLTGGDLGVEIQRLLKSHYPTARTRVDTFGYLPRAFSATVDPTDLREANDVGIAAAQNVFERSGSVALVQEDDRITTRLVDLQKVAARTRLMPESFFNPDGSISDDGRRYFQRLLPPAPAFSAPFV
jgi:ATP-dependent phosphofructokinase / diphosphate-dependent phosphofructokinase